MEQVVEQAGIYVSVSSNSPTGTATPSTGLKVATIDIMVTKDVELSELGFNVNSAVPSKFVDWRIELSNNSGVMWPTYYSNSLKSIFTTNINYYLAAGQTYSFDVYADSTIASTNDTIQLSMPASYMVVGKDVETNEDVLVHDDFPLYFGTLVF